MENLTPKALNKKKDEKLGPQILISVHHFIFWSGSQPGTTRVY